MRTRKEEGGGQYPISFISTRLQGAELNYPTIDKHAYAMFKVVNQLEPYILKNKTKVILPHLTIRNLFVQKELGERIGNWVTTLQEYDLEIKPATIVKGKGFCKLMAEIQENGANELENETELHMVYVCPIFTTPKYWYHDLVHYLQ